MVPVSPVTGRQLRPFILTFLDTVDLNGPASLRGAPRHVVNNSVRLALLPVGSSTCALRGLINTSRCHSDVLSYHHWL